VFTKSPTASVPSSKLHSNYYLSVLRLFIGYTTSKLATIHEVMLIISPITLRFRRINSTEELSISENSKWQPLSGTVFCFVNINADEDQVILTSY
jgi:hypothetical protein